MATPKMALGEGHVKQALILQIDANANVTSDTTAVILNDSTIQFSSACASPLTAAFFPLGVFGDNNGDISIPVSPNPTPAQRPGQSDVTVNYWLEGGPDGTTGPYSITVGCSPLTINLDADGNIPSEQEETQIPNGGTVLFTYPSSATQPVTLTFNPTGPFGSSLTLQPGQSAVMHAEEHDKTVAITTSQPAAGTGGSLKVGSGGSGNE